MSLGIAVVLAVMAVGSVHTAALFALSLACAAAAACAARAAPGVRPPLLAWICLGLAAYSALQALPLPAGVLDRLAPSNADVWNRSLLPAGVAPPTWTSLSLDPGASWREACRWTSYACVVFAAAMVARWRGPRWGATLLFGSGVALAVVTALHGVSGAPRVWGLYAPQFAVKPWHLGPLLNPNNLAGYLNLAFLAGLGLLVSDRGRARWATAVGLATIVAVALMSASRAGVALLPVGVLGFAIVLWLRRPRRSQRVTGIGARAPLALAAVALAAGAGLAFLGGKAGAWAELLDGSLDKLAMVDWLAPMAREHAWLGIGRGAFESVSPAHQPISGHVRFTHAEVFPLHWAIEWGALVTAIALLLFAWALRPSRLGSLRRASALGLYAGALVVLVHNLADLALEVPGVMVAVAAAVGTLAPTGQAPRRRVPPRAWLPHPLAALALSALGLALWRGHPDLDADRHALRSHAEVALQRNSAPPGFSAALNAAIRRHPAEPYFPLLGALVAHHEGRTPPMPWIQRALERGEANGRIHLLLAHLLARHRATDQALMELRLAVERDPALPEHAAALAITLTSDLAELLRSVPEGSAGVPMLTALATELHRKDAPVGLALDQEILRRDAAAIEPRVRVARARAAELAACEKGGPCHDREAWIREIESHAMQLDTVAPRSSAATRVRAQLLAARGLKLEAARLLVERCDTMVDRRACWSAGVNFAANATDPALLATASEKVLAESCATAARCAATAEWLGDTHRARGNWGAAMLYYRRALSEEESTERLLAYAEVARHLGAGDKARAALERALATSTGRRDEINRLIEGISARGQQ